MTSEFERYTLFLALFECVHKLPWIFYNPFIQFTLLIWSQLLGRRHHKNQPSTIYAANSNNNLARKCLDIVKVIGHFYTGLSVWSWKFVLIKSRMQMKQISERSAQTPNKLKSLKWKQWVVCIYLDKANKYYNFIH